MSFAAGAGFWIVLLAIPFAAWMAYLGIVRRRVLLKTLFPELISPVHETKRALKAGFLVLAIGLLGFSVLQPLWGKSLEPLTRRGRDVVIMVDVSLSMLAQDSQPTRFDSAKSGIAVLIEKLRADGGHRLGLIAFAGRATLQAPPTLDYDFLTERLAETKPDMIVRKGTSIGDALRQVAEGFVALVPDYTDLVVITDGEDHDSLPLEAVEYLRDQGVDIYMVGVGDPVDGGSVPETTEPGAPALSHQGVPVISVLDEPLLRQLARAGGGAYLAARTGPVDLSGFYDDHLASKPRREIETASEELPVHRYRWFVVLALLLLAADLLMSDKKTSQPSRTGEKA